MGARFARHTFTYPRAPRATPSDRHVSGLSPSLTPLIPLDTSAPRSLSRGRSSRFSPDVACAQLHPSRPLLYPRPPVRCQPAGFSRWARYRCVRRAPGLICEAFAGTSRPRIIIKIPHPFSFSSPLPSRPRPPQLDGRSPSVILHSIPSWINPLMAGSLICAPLQNNRELRRRARRGSVTPVVSAGLLFIRSYYWTDSPPRYRALSGGALEKNEY